MLGTLIAAIVSGETLSTLSRAKQAAVSYLLVAICGLVAAFFFLLALYVWAADAWGPIAAALAFALFFTAVAVLMLVVSRSRARSRARLAAQRRSSELMTMGVLSAVAGAPSILSGRKAKAVVAAVAVPLMLAGAYFAYRRQFRPTGDPD
jgi:hypothetical protein